MLNIESTKHNAFDDEDLKILDFLKDTAVIAIQNIQNYITARNENERFGILYKVGEKLANISEESELKDAYRIITDSIGDTFGCSAVIRRHVPPSSDPSFSSLFESSESAFSKRITPFQGLRLIR